MAKLRKHAHEEVARVATNLVDKWKTEVKREVHCNPSLSLARDSSVLD